MASKTIMRSCTTAANDYAEVRTTRSRAQEETYSSSGDDEEVDSASEPEGSELESSPASSVKPSEQQV